MASQPQKSGYEFKFVGAADMRKLLQSLGKDPANYIRTKGERIMATATAPSTNGKTDDKDKDKPRKVDFAYQGDRMIIPEGMDLDEAKLAIERQLEEENVDVQISETIKAFPLDGAVALMKVLKKRYGWTHLIPTQGFFGPRPPSMVGVDITHNETIQVPWGNMGVPKIDGTITTSYAFDNGMPQFRLSGTVKRKHERVVAAIAAEIREFIRTESIYRGKAIKINFRDGDGDRRDFDINLTPKFINLETLGDTEPIFSKPIENAIRINIYNPIRYSKRCKDKGASRKKGIVLGGPYGTGKTLTAFQCAKVCMENGWTFLYVEDVRDLDLALNFAKMYQPCVVFGEDMDKMASGPRTPDMDKMLNTIDGVESKGDDSLITVLTTNHLEVINRAFLRPGRIDAVINVTPPDKEACLRIVKKYVADGDCKLTGSDDDLGEAIKCLVGANAAFFRCTVEQAKLAAIENMPDDAAEVVIGPDELRVVAEGMLPHCKLINPEHGQKSLLDLEGDEAQDPLVLAGEILTQKFCEVLMSNIANPKTLEKIIFKKMGKRRNNPSNN